MIADFQKCVTKRFPFELWLNTSEENHITLEVLHMLGHELIARPDDGTLHAITKSDSWSGLGKDVEIFYLDLCDLLQFQRSTRNLTAVSAESAASHLTFESCYHNRSCNSSCL